jgi:hypothetical protein
MDKKPFANEKMPEIIAKTRLELIVQNAIYGNYHLDLDAAFSSMFFDYITCSGDIRSPEYLMAKTPFVKLVIF